MTSATRPARTLAACAWLLAAAAIPLGCRYDPVPQEAIDALPEDSKDPSELHRPGEPCVLCHSTYEGAEPELAIGGTVYALDTAGTPQPAVNVYVAITDSAGGFNGICTNGAGNFYFKKDDLTDLAFPLTVTVGSSRMTSLIGRDGSCASCHKLPDENSLDAKTGAGRDSPGVVLVTLNGPDPNCK